MDVTALVSFARFRRIALQSFPKLLAGAVCRFFAAASDQCGEATRCVRSISRTDARAIFAAPGTGSADRGTREVADGKGADPLRQSGGDRKSSAESLHLHFEFDRQAGGRSASAFPVRNARGPLRVFRLGNDGNDANAGNPVARGERILAGR